MVAEEASAEVASAEVVVAEVAAAAQLAVAELAVAALSKSHGCTFETSRSRALAAGGFAGGTVVLVGAKGPPASVANGDNNDGNLGRWKSWPADGATAEGKTAEAALPICKLRANVVSPLLSCTVGGQNPLITCKTAVVRRHHTHSIHVLMRTPPHPHSGGSGGRVTIYHCCRALWVVRTHL